MGYPRLFRGARRLIEINIERYGLTLEEAAAHLTKAEIERHADIRYTPTPKASPKEQTMDEYIDQLLAEFDVDPAI